jgi:hypothetical protein
LATRERVLELVIDSKRFLCTKYPKQAGQAPL